MTLLLFAVFITHLPFFLWRYYRSGEIRFAATSLTFLLLTLTYGTRLFAPEVTLWDTPLFWWFRVPAWIAAAVSLSLFARHLLRGRRRDTV